MTEIRYRDRVLQLTDATYVLADIRAAFNLPTAVLRFASTEVVAAAMPHEPITRLDVAYDLFVPVDDALAGGRADGVSSLEESAQALQLLIALGGHNVLEMLSASGGGREEYAPESATGTSRLMYSPGAYSPFRVLAHRTDGYGGNGPAGGGPFSVRWRASAPPYHAPVEPYVLLPPPDSVADLPAYIQPQTFGAAEARLSDLRALKGGMDARQALLMAEQAAAASARQEDVKPQIT